MLMNKLHQNEKGFSHIVLILAGILILGLIGFAAMRVMEADKKDKEQSNSTKQTPTSEKSSSSESDLQLQNFGLASFDSIAITKNALRDFDSKGLKGFYIFGDKLEGGRTNPNFEFASLQEGTEVISAIDGVVTFIREQAESGDTEVFVQPKEGSAWTIGYDHLISLKVAKGDTVKAGDVLGMPARQNNGALRFEIQINKDAGGKTTHYCPSTLLTSDTRDKLLADLKSMQTKWETDTGYELYDVDSQNPIGCTKATMSVAEAEGR